MKFKIQTLLSCMLAVLPAQFAARGSEGPAPRLDNYSARVWGLREGLPQGRVQVVTQTDDGYLWIGTSGGLARFDGTRFISYKRENTPDFVDDSILSLLPGEAGSLWIGTEGGGLMRFSGKTFRSYSSKTGLTNGFVRALFQDKSGALWVGTDHGLFRLSGDDFQRIDGHGRVPFVSVRTFYEDREGRLWVGGNGLYEIRGASLVPHPLAGEMADSTISAIRQMDDGCFWLATEGGLHQWSYGARVTTPVRGAPPLGGPTVGLVMDHDGGLWSGMTSAGLLRYRQSVFDVVRSPAQLPGNNILALFVDRAGNLWLSTEDGLVRLTTPLARAITLKDGLENDNITVTYQDRDETLLLADITGRIYRLSGAALSQITLPWPFQKTEARTFYRDRSGALWIGTARDGILRVEDGKIRHYTTRNGLRSDIIRAICEDDRGNIWIGTSSGLSRWDGHHFRGYYLEDGLVYASVHVIFRDHAGDLWVGTDGGLNIIHNDEIVSSSVTENLRNERIRAIYEDPHGGVWLGTRGGGLIRVRQGKTRRISMDEGLPDNRIFQILDDAAGNLWLSGPRGLCHLRRSELDSVADGLSNSVNVLLYDASDIVGTNEMSGMGQPAGCKTSNGNLWFPTIHGAIGIDPAKLRRSARLNVLIEGAYVDDRAVSLDRDQIQIPPGARKLEIDYTAINLTSPEQMIFSYKMEGFDAAWTNAHARRTAYYTNLTPGNYRFRLNVEDGVESRNYAEAGLGVQWMPHYYQTAWFYAMIVMAIAFAAWSGFKFYSHQTHLRYALVLGERTRLARELHDTLIQGCVGVSTLLEAASSLRHVNASAAADILDRAREEIRLTLDEARQAVCDLRDESGHGNLAMEVRAFIEQLNRDQGVNAHAEVRGATVSLEERVNRNLFMVAKEALRNAAAHAHARLIQVQLSFEEDEIRLEVTDDGCGFELNSAPVGNGHYGLVGMHERMRQIGGYMSIASRPGEGTKVIAGVPRKAATSAQSEFIHAQT